MRMHVVERRAWPEFEDASSSSVIRPNLWTLPRPEQTVPLIPRLASLIETEIVPRLVLAKRIAELPIAPVRAGDHDLVTAKLGEFTQVILSGGPAETLSYVEALWASGASLESLYLDLMWAASHRLEQLWHDDLIDFTQVTAGLLSLQHVVRALGVAFQGDTPCASNGHRALMLTVPGEQQGFALAMIGEFLRRAGWSPYGGPGMPVLEVVGLVRGQRFAMVCLSISRESRLEALASEIRQIRRSSQNRAIGVMVEGPMFLEHPELVGQIGADATPSDPGHAPGQALDLLALRRRRR